MRFFIPLLLLVGACSSSHQSVNLSDEAMNVLINRVSDEVVNKLDKRESETRAANAFTEAHGDGRIGFFWDPSEKTVYAQHQSQYCTSYYRALLLAHIIDEGEEDDPLVAESHAALRNRVFVLLPHVISERGTWSACGSDHVINRLTQIAVWLRTATGSAPDSLYHSQLRVMQAKAERLLHDTTLSEGERMRAKLEIWASQ